MGESAAGLEILRQGLKLNPELAKPLVKAHLDPVPQLKAGRLLARNRLAGAAIDPSDGVATDLCHICQASRTGARLEGAAVPIPAGVQAAARLLGIDPLDLALKGGEDYQLLFTVRPEQSPQLTRIFRQARLPLPVKIGEITPGREVTLITPSGEEVISGAGFDHFRLDLNPRKE